jgi:hypothetical protein
MPCWPKSTVPDWLTWPPGLSSIASERCWLAVIVHSASKAKSYNVCLASYKHGAFLFRRFSLTLGLCARVRNEAVPVSLSTPYLTAGSVSICDLVGLLFPLTTGTACHQALQDTPSPLRGSAATLSITEWERSDQWQKLVCQSRRLGGHCGT